MTDIWRTTRLVHHTQFETDIMQLRIKGLFRKDDPDNPRTAVSEGFSYAHPEGSFNDELAMSEAINEAQWKLGSSGWALIELWEKETFTYKIVPLDQVLK